MRSWESVDEHLEGSCCAASRCFHAVTTTVTSIPIAGETGAGAPADVRPSIFRARPLVCGARLHAVHLCTPLCAHLGAAKGLSAASLTPVLEPRLRRTAAHACARTANATSPCTRGVQQQQGGGIPALDTRHRPDIAHNSPQRPLSTP
eukprot:scaffold1149_cov380-Prasinococcus_capsulatus_cf.AAC.5